MKRSNKIAALIISACTILIVFVIFVWFITNLGCGCIQAPPTVAVNLVKNDTGSYYNVTYVTPRSAEEVKNLKIVLDQGDNLTTTYYLKSKLTPGASYLFKVDHTDIKHATVSVIADGNEIIVYENDR